MNLTRTELVVEDFQLVVWGSGRIGLGLVADRACAAGVPTCLAVRREGSNPRLANSLHTHRSFRVSNPSGTRLTTVGSVLWNDTVRGAAALMKLLTETRDVLFVTSARAGGQLGAVPVIKAAVAARRSAGNKGLFLLAPCENDTVGPLADLAWTLLGEGFVYLDVMVDRICPQIAPGKGNLYDVIAEPSYEWAASPKMAPAGNVRSFQRVQHTLRNLDMTVQSDITLIKARKRFLMNGVQTCLALLATIERCTTLEEYMTLDAEALDELSEVYAIALATEHPELDNESEMESNRRWYSQRIVDSGRLTAEGDTPARIISRLYSGSSSSYLHDIASKVAMARDAYTRAQRRYDLKPVENTKLGKAYDAAIALARLA